MRRTGRRFRTTLGHARHKRRLRVRRARAK